MAMPQDPIVVWAREDVTLPGTGRINKVKPIDDLLDKGYDKGQKPAAEEFNYILNQSSGWISWIVNEKFPDLEREIARLLQELETRINQQLTQIRQDISQIRVSIADLRRYVDQQVTNLRQEIQQVASDLSQLRRDMDAALVSVHNRIDQMSPLLVPVGGIMQWPGANPPPGWLECNGQVFNTTDNPQLFAALGTNSVPDYRGLFLRGWAHGSSFYDPDFNRGIGSIQMDELKSHDHSINVGLGILQPNANTNIWTGVPDNNNRTGFSGGAETRPKNAAVMYIIKTDLASSSGTISPSGITVSPSLIENQVGYSTQLTAELIPSSLSSQYPITWSVEDDSVATVTPTGNLTLVGNGETRAVASISTGMMVYVRVVSSILLTSVAIADPGGIEMGTSVILSATRSPSNATESLSYSSSNDSVILVTNDGNATGLAVGTADVTITGQISGISFTRTLTVTPRTVDEVVQDIQFGAVTIADFDNGYNQVPAGCTVVGGDWYVDTGEARVGYKPVQKKVNGVWVIIAG